MILYIYADFGLTLALIAAGSAIASMVGSGISSHQNRKAQQRINEQQMRMADETNQLNINEAQKEREWNDYSNQSARMMQAGLNPATMFGGQGTPINSNAQANGVTPPSLGVPSYDYMFGDPGSFEQIASAINQISSANLTEQERQDLINTAIDRYNKIANDASKSDYDRAIAKIDADFYENYGMELKRNEFQVVKNTANKIYNESENLVKQGNFIEAETELSKARKETEVEIKKFKGKEREALEARLKRIDELIDNEIKESKSRQYANVTGANAAAKQADVAEGNLALGWQEYNNPKDLEGAIVRTLEKDPKEAGKVVFDVIEGASESVLNRLSASTKKWMLETLEDDIQLREKHDPNPWNPIEKYFRKKKKEKIAALKQGKWR